jgi:hypothetical protein
MFGFLGWIGRCEVRFIWIIWIYFFGERGGGLEGREGVERGVL